MRLLEWMSGRGGPKETPPARVAQGGSAQETAVALGEPVNMHDIDGLLTALWHKKVGVRRQAAEALGKLREPRTVEALIDALGDTEWEVREAAALALSALADKKAVGPLVALLNSPDSTSAAKILAGEGGEQSLDWDKIKASRAKMQKAHEAAALALGVIGDREAVAPLVQALERRLWLRRTRLGAGNLLKPEEVIKALEDEPEVIRRLVSLRATSYLRSGSAAAQMQYLLTDADGFARLELTAVATLVKALDSLPFFVGSGFGMRSGGRDVLARIIGDIKPRPDDECVVEKAIVRALGRLGGEQAQKTLADICARPSHFLREVAAASLAEMADVEARSSEEKSSETWTCAKCRKTLAPMDWSRGAVTLGTLPTLYDGVICSTCGKLECVACKGSKVDAPCSWCSGPVSPAYENLLKRPPAPAAV